MKQSQKFFKYTALFFGIVVAGVFAFSYTQVSLRGVVGGSPYYGVPMASAATSATSAELKGFAWSGTIGWISFNCATDPGGCSGHDYKVSVDTTNRSTGGQGTLRGFAWSPNIGWVSFNSEDIVNCPEGSCNAQINWKTGAVSGWAHACAGTTKGDCSGADRADGWDGWIKLSGVATNPQQSPYGPILDQTTGKFSGYSWGSEVVGWVSWNYTLAGVEQGGVNTNLPPLLSAPTDVTATVNQTCPSTQVVLIWKSPTAGTNITYDVKRNGTTIGQTPGTSYTDASPLIGALLSYSIVAHDASNNRAESTPVSPNTNPIPVCPPPVHVTLTANGVSAVRVTRGTPITLVWTTINNPKLCVADSSDSASTWKGSRSPSGGTKTVTPNGLVTYSITCYEKVDRTGTQDSSSVTSYLRIDFNITPQ
ncbi:MAG: hypothetical protein ACYC8S_01035 [Minisyncoccota bacterium]